MRGLLSRLVPAALAVCAPLALAHAADGECAASPPAPLFLAAAEAQR